MTEPQFRSEAFPSPFAKAWSRTQRLLAGSTEQKRYLLRMASYRLQMKMRGIDVVPAESNGYVDSGGPNLEPILHDLSICDTDAVIDLGCGKGGAVLTLARFPFAKADGVEIIPDLADCARSNLARAGIRKSEIYCRNAVEFRELDSYNYIYMYNPFPPNVLGRVMANVNDSIARQPRRLTVVYQTPADHHVIVAAGFQLIRSYQDGLGCYIYVNQQ